MMQKKQKYIVKISLVLFILFTSLIFFLSKDLLAKETNDNNNIIKFAFIPDMNYTYDKKNDYRLFQQSPIILQDIIRELNKEKKLDFVIFGGNLIANNDNKLTELQPFIDELLNLNISYYTILGSNEATLKEELTKKDFVNEFEFNGFNDNTKTYWVETPYSETNFVLIGLDTTILNQNDGEVSEEQYAWLTDTLNKHKDDYIIISMHHTVLGEKLNDESFEFKDSQKFIDFVKKYPQIKLILSGHDLKNHAEKINNTLYLSCPSPIVYPNKYKIIEVSSSKNTVRITNKQLSFKQIIKIAKENLLKSELSENYDNKKPKNILNYVKGNKFSNHKSYN